MKGLERLQLGLAFLPELPKCIVLFVALAFGSGLAESIVSMIPEVVTSGLDYATGLMPAVGIALLLKMMWSNKMAVWCGTGNIFKCSNDWNCNPGRDSCSHHDYGGAWDTGQSSGSGSIRGRGGFVQ